ncbi:uncharacterized protein N7479_005707 [Penicillium vulpinum]|uniref:Uncharacterized protein n=1 Tax=Penicillium vulpinum TaxID=29845 RepID=A0A1V6SFG2_9EURO|nr:uncharacterized protein N7479_005707 [Penicillium vulpinum]KAJ5958557.1 hypothetical protein N7479_005707 [Penicillium vulpinum]OQE12510.1 hypothetical protein PENVUL_c001G09840 [Penicillium vulpinum]
MVSNTINFSGLMCLALALGPTAVLSAPQLPALPPLPFPEIIHHGPETTSQGPGNSQTSAGSGVKVGIPGGPYVNVGVGFLDAHRGPCGPASGDDHNAGAGVSVGIPGGPSVNLGNGEHHHQDGHPCPEPPAVVIVPTTTVNPSAVVAPTTTVNPPAVVVVPTTTASPPTEIIPPATEIVTPPAAAVTPTAETIIPPAWTAISAIFPPTFTTPISVPLTTAPAAWASTGPTIQFSTPLIHRPAPTASASPSAVPSAPITPVFNAASALTPGSVLAVAVPIILAFFN